MYELCMHVFKHACLQTHMAVCLYVCIRHAWLSMYICIYICMCAYMYVLVPAHISMSHMYAHMHIGCMHVNIFVCMQTCKDVFVYICVCMYVCVHEGMHVSGQTWISVCIFACTYVYLQKDMHKYLCVSMYICMHAYLYEWNKHTHAWDFYITGCYYTNMMNTAIMLNRHTGIC